MIIVTEYNSIPKSRYSQSSSPGRERGHARRHSSADAHQEEGEELTDQTATLTLTSATARQRAQSDSQHDRRRDGKEQVCKSVSLDFLGFACIGLVLGHQMGGDGAYQQMISSFNIDQLMSYIHYR